MNPPDLLLCRLLDEQYTHHPFYVSWRLINTMDADFCVERLEETLRCHGKPEIFNRDQGSQFTRVLFTGVLEREKIRIAMDGRGGSAWIVDRFIKEGAEPGTNEKSVQRRGVVDEAECTA